MRDHPHGLTWSLTDATQQAISPPSPPDYIPARDAIGPGDSLGRYTVLELVGAGGMGEVYAAHDPQLDRRVAVKVMHPGIGGQSPDARARFQREAQAMAQLNHPNIVSVFDGGVVGDRMFVAMELVEGPTLAAWLAEGPRPWRSVVEVFLQAGRGLEAAHAAGIVHRDFKPSNVILGDRVRVADFGLARMARDRESPSGPETNLLATAISRAGAVIGTPAYMAPEQRDGQPGTPLSDQYSFGLALREALSGGPAPRRLRAIVDRALAPRPEDRYPSMRELCADLARDPGRARRRIAAAAAAVVLLGGYGLAARRGGLEPPCAGGAARLMGIWDAGRRDAVHAAFAATGLSFSDDTWRRASARLDDYAGRWVAMHGEACRATRVEGRQSAALLDLRMSCLERRRGVLGALTTLWSRDVTAETVEHAIDSAGGLPPLEECADADALAERRSRPADPVQAAKVAAARPHLDTVHALTLAGRWPEAAKTAALARAEAEATGWPQLRAEAAFASGVVLAKLADKGAEPVLLEAARLAADAHDDRLAAQALIRLAEHLGDGQQTPARGLVAADLAEVAVARAGDDHELRAELLQSHGLALFAASQLDAARADFVAAHAHSVMARGAADPATLERLAQIARVAVQQGDDGTARRLYERVLATMIPLVGAGHPKIAAILNNLAMSVEDAGDDAGAVMYHRWSLGIKERALGPDSVGVALTLNNLGALEAQRGRLDEARSLLVRALALRERLLGGEHAHVATTLNALALVRRKQGAFEEALGLLERALAIDSKNLGAAHAKLSYRLAAIGQVHEAMGDAAGALDAYRRSLAIREPALGPQHKHTRWTAIEVARMLARLHRCDEARPLLAAVTPDDEARALAARADCELAAGHASRAAGDLDRALTLHKDSDAVFTRGAIRWRLALALAAAGRRDAAVAAARQAVGELSVDADGALDRAAAAAWLRRHLAASGHPRPLKIAGKTRRI